MTLRPCNELKRLKVTILGSLSKKNCCSESIHLNLLSTISAISSREIFEMLMEEKEKILLCGDVEGKFDALLSKVRSVNTKSGPFDALFCVGNFYGINNQEFLPYKSGQKKMPIPTFILGPNNPDHLKLYPENDGYICDNITYLGKRGIYTSSKGLKVAYISGLSSSEDDLSDLYYSKQDIQDLYDSCIKGNAAFKGLDILLTSQWPKKIAAAKGLNLLVNKDSDLPCWLTMKLKPRYHVAGLEGVYIDHNPFRCPNLGDQDTTLNITTRFIGLARVGNPKKDKWLYALSLTPLEKMKMTELIQKTTDEVDCPYNFFELEQRIFNVKRRAVESRPQYFYDTSAPPEECQNKRQKRPKIEFDQSKCWFCLASPTVEKDLIVTIGEKAYLALAKGGLVNEHLLICPIEHYRNTLDQPDDVTEEIDKFKEALCKFYKSRNRLAVFFERNYKTTHMQLQVVPVPEAVRDRLRHVFLDYAEAHGIKLQLLEAPNRLQQVLKPNFPYFTVELPNGDVLYAKIRGNFPLNFGREVLANNVILNLPNRIDWKACVTVLCLFIESFQLWHTYRNLTNFYSILSNRCGFLFIIHSIFDFT